MRAIEEDVKEKSKKKRKYSNGEGSITRRPAFGTPKNGTVKWEVCVVVGKKADGSPQKKYKTCKSEKEAREERDKLLQEVKSGFVTPIKNSQKDFGEFIKFYIENYKKNSIRQTTYEQYQIYITKHIIPKLGALQLIEITTDHIQEFMNIFLGEYKVGTFKNIFKVIYSSLEHAAATKKIPYNPSKAIKIPKEEKTEITILTTEQVKKIQIETVDHYYHGAFMLQLKLALRKGEVRGLRWKNIDFLNKEINITNTLVYTKDEGYQFNLPKTDASASSIPLTEELLAILQTHKEKQKLLKEGKGEGWNAEDLVFCTHKGNYIDNKSYQRIFQNMLSKLGLPIIRVHDMRHTVGTHLVGEYGVDIKTASTILRHSNTNMLTRVYLHTTEDMKRKALEKMVM